METGRLGGAHVRLVSSRWPSGRSSGCCRSPRELCHYPVDRHASLFWDVQGDGAGTGRGI